MGSVNSFQIDMLLFVLLLLSQNFCIEQKQLEMVYIYWDSQNRFFETLYYKFLFQMVKNFFFSQKGHNQVTEWLNNDFYGVFLCPHWDFEWTQKFIDIQVFNKLPPFKEAYEPKGEFFFGLTILLPMIDQFRS